MKHFIIVCLFALTSAVACKSGGTSESGDESGNMEKEAASQPASQPAE